MKKETKKILILSIYTVISVIYIIIRRASRAKDLEGFSSSILDVFTFLENILIFFCFILVIIIILYLVATKIFKFEIELLKNQKQDKNEDKNEDKKM